MRNPVDDLNGLDGHGSYKVDIKQCDMPREMQQAAIDMAKKVGVSLRGGGGGCWVIGGWHSSLT